MNQYLVGPKGEQLARNHAISDHVMDGQAALMDLVNALVHYIPRLRRSLQQAQGILLPEPA